MNQNQPDLEKRGRDGLHTTGGQRTIDVLQIDKDDIQLTDISMTVADSLQNQQLERKVSGQASSNKPYISNAMQQLRTVLQDDNTRLFQSIGFNMEVTDYDENIMIIYVAAICMNDEQVFNHIVARNNQFNIRPEWNKLFKNTDIFSKLPKFPGSSPERMQLDNFVLKASLDKELSFITELVLTRAVVTPEMLRILLLENQKKLIISLLTKTIKPLYKPPTNSIVQFNYARNINFKDERDLHFVDIIETALMHGAKSSVVIEFMKLMQLELDNAGGRPVAAQNYLKSINRGEMSDAEYISSELDYNQLFSLFVVKRKIRLLRHIYNLPQEQFKQDHVKLFLRALDMDAYDVAALIHKEFFRLLRDASKEDEESIITTLTLAFGKTNGMIDFKCYLIRQHIERLQLGHATRLLEALDIKVMSRNKSNILVVNLNVVKTSCLLIEVLAAVGTRFQSLAVRSNQVRDKIIAIASEYMLKVEQEEEMKFLLLEKDFEHRDSLDLITEHYIEELLTSQHAENVVREIWRSSYATQDSIFNASSNHIFTWHFWHCVRDIENDHPLCRVKTPGEIESHPMQFTVWRYSPKARMGIEFLVTVAFAIAIHFMVQQVIDQVPVITPQWQQYLNLQSQLAQNPNTSSQAYITQQNNLGVYYESIYPDMFTFYRLMMNITFVSFSILFFALQHIPEIIYTSITKRVYNPYAFKNLLDFLIFVLFMTNIWITYYKNLHGTWKERLYDGDKIRMTVFLTIFIQGNPEREVWLLIFCSISLWIRTVFLLRYNEYLGRITGVLEKMAYDLTIYFIFFLLEILFFSFVAELAFRQMDNYNSTLHSFRTLFYASFGQFNFDYMRQSEYGEYFGISFLVIFLVVNIGLFMSFFISMITVLYGEFAKNHNVHHMLQTLKTRPVTKADKQYSCLISIPPPLNVFLLLLAPFLCTSKNPEMWNKVILWVAYLPILIITSTIFLAYSLLLFPVTYVKLVFHKLVMIFVYSKSYRVTKADKFAYWILFMVIGLFRLFLNVFTDFAAFLRHSVVTDLKKTKVSNRQKPLSKDTLVKLSKYLEVRNERMVPFKQVSSETREKMEIQNKLRNFLLPQPQMSFMPCAIAQASQPASVTLELQQKEFNPVYEKIKEYGTVKQILESNSQIVLYNNMRVRSIDCKIMSVLVSDACHQNSISKVNDDNYIFIRRAVSVKQSATQKKKIAQRAKMGQDALNYLEDSHITNVDYEHKLEADKRVKKIVRKLIYLNTSRLLTILGYTATENDTKRLDYALIQFGSKDPSISQQLIAKAQKNESLLSFLQEKDTASLEVHVNQLNTQIPKFDHSLLTMQKEIQLLVENFSQDYQKQKDQKQFQQMLQKLQNFKFTQEFSVKNADDKGNKDQENIQQSPVKHMKKIALKDLRQKRNKPGYLSAGDDSDVPYMSDNNM